MKVNNKKLDPEKMSEMYIKEYIKLCGEKLVFCFYDVQNAYKAGMHDALQYVVDSFRAEEINLRRVYDVNGRINEYLKNICIVEGEKK